MNVLFVFVLPSGGVETLNVERAKALRVIGIDSHLLYFYPGSGLQNQTGIPTMVTQDPVEIQHILLAHQYAAIVVVSCYEQLGLFRQLGFTGRLILEVQGFGSKERARSELSKAVPDVTAYADALLAPETSHIIELFGQLYPHKMRFHFHLPIDAAAFAYRPLQRLGRPVAAWIGRLEDNKNWRDFLRIGAELIRHHPELILWIFEDPSLAAPGERDNFNIVVAQFGLGAHLELHGYVPHAQMADYLSVVGDSGGFLCMTSKVESAGYVALEAMSCRCPVLTTDSDGVRSAVIAERTGLYYGHGDIKGAADQARRLLCDPALRGRIVEEAQLHVRQVFHPIRYAGHFQQMLRALAVL